MKGPVFGFLGDADMSAVSYPCNDGQGERAGQDGASTEEERSGVASCDINQPTCTGKRRDVRPPRDGRRSSQHRASRFLSAAYLGIKLVVVHLYVCPPPPNAAIS